MSRLRALFDTNVILDWMFQDRPRHAEATELFRAVSNCELDAFVTPTSLATISYVAGRVLTQPVLMDCLGAIRKLCGVATQDAGVVDDALHGEEADFEDGLILCAARAAGCSVIVSRDEKAFIGFEGAKVDEKGCLDLI